MNKISSGAIDITVFVCNCIEVCLSDWHLGAFPDPGTAVDVVIGISDKLSQSTLPVKDQVGRCLHGRTWLDSSSKNPHGGQHAAGGCLGGQGGLAGGWPGDCSCSAGEDGGWG